MTFCVAFPSCTCLAADPNCNVLTVSLRLLARGLTLTNKQALPSPPRELCISCVNLEFLYGTCMAFVLRAANTWPSADSDLLIAAASTSLCPVASVLEILSEPAKSTRVSVPRVTAFVTRSVPWSFSSRSR